MNKTATIIVSILLVLIIALGGVLFFTLREKPQAPLPANQVVLSTDAVDVSVTYPVIPGGNMQITVANQMIRNDIDARIAAFQKDAKENQPLGTDLPKEVKSTVSGSPATEEYNDRYVALFMGMEWYLRGAAHPSHTIDTYVYDYQANALVTSADFFKGEYLVLLSTLAREDLRAQSKEGDLGFTVDEVMLEEGTEPRIENFKHMLPLKDGLAIYFEEYQVAPYAAGPQQVVIPYSKLKEIINPEGVLGMYIQ